MAISMKLKRIPSLGAPRFTRNEMREIATAVRDAEAERMHQALKPDLSPAKPLTKNYAISKTKKLGGRAIRDWRLKNDLPASLKVTVSSPNMGIVKFPAQFVRKALVREQKDEMFSLSERGELAGTKVARKYLDKALNRAVK